MKAKTNAQSRQSGVWRGNRRAKFRSYVTSLEAQAAIDACDLSGTTATREGLHPFHLFPAFDLLLLQYL